MLTLGAPEVGRRRWPERHHTRHNLGFGNFGSNQEIIWNKGEHEVRNPCSNSLDPTRLVSSGRRRRRRRRRPENIHSRAPCFQLWSRLHPKAIRPKQIDRSLSQKVRGLPGQLAGVPVRRRRRPEFTPSFQTGATTGRLIHTLGMACKFMGGLLMKFRTCLDRFPTCRSNGGGRRGGSANSTKLGF